MTSCCIVNSTSSLNNRIEINWRKNIAVHDSLALKYDRETRTATAERKTIDDAEKRVVIV